MNMDLQAALERRAQVEAFQRQHRIGLLTLLFTDLVGSTRLKQELGDRRAVALMQQHHALVREILDQFNEGQEISTAGDSFFIVFAKPSDAAQFALLVQARLRALGQETGQALFDRIGIHVGEVIIEERPDAPKPLDLYGLQVDTSARVMSLGEAGQILLTRAAFDNARQVLKGGNLPGMGPLAWLNHGPYLLKGVEEPLEICEVGEAGLAPLQPPPDSDKVHRYLSPDAEPVLGWRPALGQAVPNTRWVLEEKLGEGGFGEVWLGRHDTLKERRVFKFCFRADRVRSLKREVTLFRLLKERAGDNPHIVGVHEVFLEQPPYYLILDYATGKDLRAWSETQGGLGQIPLATRLDIVAQAAEAVQAAHDAGVLHRDIKPSNILIQAESATAGPPLLPPTDPSPAMPAPPLLSPESPAPPMASASQRPEPPMAQPPVYGLMPPPLPAPPGLDSESGAKSTPSPIVPSKVQVKLTDFGIGQVISQEALAGMTRLGFTQTVLGAGAGTGGTQMYLAPELVAGKPASPQSDIYSLGVLLYQMLAEDLSRPLTMDWEREIQDPFLRADLSLCLAGNPQERFARAGQLAAHLRAHQSCQAQWQAALAQQAAAVARQKQQRRWRIAALLVAAVFLLPLASWLPLLLVAASLHLIALSPIGVALAGGLVYWGWKRRARRRFLKFTSKPTGAEIWLDGAKTGQAPRLETSPRPGWHVLELKLPGGGTGPVKFLADETPAIKLAFAFLAGSPEKAGPAPFCPPIVVAAKGEAYSRKSSSAAWQPLEVPQLLFQGASLRTRPNSEVVVRLGGGRLLKITGQTELAV